MLNYMRFDIVIFGITICLRAPTDVRLFSTGIRLCILYDCRVSQPLMRVSVVHGVSGFVRYLAFLHPHNVFGLF